MAAVLRPSSIVRAAAPAVEPDRKPAVAADAVKVMLVDDSLTVRTVFSRMISSEPDLTVVAQAETAEKALVHLRTTAVDVILLDLEMPGMGGLEALPAILKGSAGARVLVVSSLTETGAKATLSALSIGAADTMLKPRPGGFNEEYRETLLGKIRALGTAKNTSVEGEPALHAAAPQAISSRKRPHVVAIGASTGGIHALNLFLRKLPAAFDLPILITQHLPESFIPVFARQMETAAGRPALLADEGTPIERGKIIIAPGHGHLIARKLAGRVVTGLAHHRVESGCMPSVDPMLETLCEAYNGHVAAVVLSGMGRDGSQGAKIVAEAGGAIYAQDEASSAVWGMPRGVIESGLASAILPPGDLAEQVAASAGDAAWS
ncbi:chemotaxis-specific protein-glutamate methyltransferase CheB [Qipengyuania sp. MTN3-11]|uniref:chemotaxis-specific protein-glutamate methyltransferase CheB n=1 Tax=Qipengyuania sp. MTN3-11 TaxID=3056557 RepID=UPI0036F2D33A